ncbi:phosphoribosyltransferase family protein [Paraflavisolibacter sp. H34]|uniref:phosphoribosyltransferase family protein n=1 Tax=Huijunlia imazamoxiresistens TaxID=3127457 RepID=UPI0030176ED8
MNTVDTNVILQAADIQRKIYRMALEVAERNADCPSLIIAGVEGHGVVVAQNVIRALQKIASFQIHFVTILIDKQQPLEASINSSLDFNNQTIIVVDDVADTGRTLMYCVKPFLNYVPKSIQTLVLVERSHKVFPVQTDYVGLSLATTLQEHIRVQTEGEAITGAMLF